MTTTIAKSPFTSAQRRELLSLVRSEALIEDLAVEVRVFRASRVDPDMKDAQVTARVRAIERRFSAALATISHLPRDVAAPLALRVWGLRRGVDAGALDHFRASVAEFVDGVRAELQARGTAARPGRRPDWSADWFARSIEVLLREHDIGDAETIRRVLRIGFEAAGEDCDPLGRHVERQRKAATRRRTNRPE